MWSGGDSNPSTQTKFPAAPASGVASASEMSAGATPRSGGMRASEPPGNLGAAPPWGLPLPSPPLSNRDAAAGREGGNRWMELLITTSPGKPRGHFR